MKKTFFIVATVLIACQVSYGQKTSVGILPFTFFEEASDYQVVSAIQEEITNAFVEAKRFNIVDRAKLNALKFEKELQKTEDFIDGKVVAQSASMGAEYLVSGHVISAEVEEIPFSDGTTGYKAKLSINLKVIEVATGQVITSSTIEPKAGNLLAAAAGVGPQSPEAAFSKALKDIKKDIDEFLVENFPLTVSIAEISEEKGGEASVVLISVGSKYGVEKKDEFKVVVISQMEVDGKQLTRKKDIGKIRVSAVEDENFSKCDVKDGGKDIFDKFNSGENIKCISLK